MKDIGADVAFNYKTTSTAEVLEKEGPIDMSVTMLAKYEITFDADESCIFDSLDSVSGETPEAALEAPTMGARFIVSFYFFCA
jgi:hypothetical protein